MTPELKSCPFCGGAAQLAKDYHANRWMVFCPGSLCALDTVEASGIHPSDAVAAWNTRVVPVSTPTRAATVSVDDFVAFIGNGENAIGRFPANLSELNAALKEFAARALPSSKALSDEERKRTGLMKIEARTVAEARAWLANDFSVPVPRLDHLLRIIDRLTGAPK
jgi:hypothetical protein